MNTNVDAPEEASENRGMPEQNQNSATHLILDLHIKATSPEEAEAIAIKIAGFERLSEFPVGTGLTKGSLRVRGTLQLREPFDPNCITNIQVADKDADTQNGFLDKGWEVSGNGRKVLLFSHALPERRTTASNQTSKPASKQHKNKFLQSLISLGKHIGLLKA
jgi:hypothetical protein